MSEKAEEVRQALKLVIDPELGQNVVDLGLIYAITVIDDCVLPRSRRRGRRHLPLWRTLVWVAVGQLA